MTLYLIATIGMQTVALPATVVESVVEATAIAPVPRAPVHVAGLAALRSRVITLIDTHASLELGRMPAPATASIVVVVVDGHHYGLLVDRVEDVVVITQPPVPIGARLAAGWARAAAGTMEHDGRWLLLLDPAALVAGPPAARAA